MQKKITYCPLDTAVNIISGKWKLFILVRLLEGPLRYGRIKASCTNISEKVLTNQLRSLEDSGIIIRKVYPEIPPKVEYSISELGMELMNALKPLYEWGVKFEGTTDNIN
ncbi:DNA-binding transcriptional regulator, HxlR family [Tenacibaculum sp. MAR_2009_124]|uniref:winged helix-turn-helix transcriptional regulator n=1 Tax=Tenacibaculum sp. MAR_2009_124 TaxID=1250059 RepID=UPI000894A414|nr:helix-turn-helix domain-containing protein [Tenacibaculum sp. MAR_2009_124]SEB79764.1 DNA-binding transcriptional regulator, HxlR family [Tenacibaculum sp. MAR_2009_124]